MWHVSFRSGVATLRTAIRLLLTYFTNNDPAQGLHTLKSSPGPGTSCLDAPHPLIPFQRVRLHPVLPRIRHLRTAAFPLQMVRL